MDRLEHALVVLMVSTRSLEYPAPTSPQLSSSNLATAKEGQLLYQHVPVRLCFYSFGIVRPEQLLQKAL